MAVHVRLRRIGKGAKGKPHYRISVFDERTARDGRVLEEIGFWNPISKETKLNAARLEYWVKNGAKMSDTVARLAKKTRSAKE
jgi:small subunit ribosomal protein S16